MLNGIVDASCFCLAMERDILMTRDCNGTMETLLTFLLTFLLTYDLGEISFMKVNFY